MNKRKSHKSHENNICKLTQEDEKVKHVCFKKEENKAL